MGLSYNTQDGLYDIAWSEIHENQLVTASGDGSLKLWDITLKVGQEPSFQHACRMRPSHLLDIANLLGHPDSFRICLSALGTSTLAKCSVLTGQIRTRNYSPHPLGMDT